MRAEHRLRDGGQTADRASTPRSRAGTTRAHHPGGDLLALQASAGNRAVGRLIAALAVQRCGPNSDCGCPPEEKFAAELDTGIDTAQESSDEPLQKLEEASAATAMPVQRDRMAASGFAQPLNEQEEFNAAHRKTADGKPVTNCWEPQSQDFKVAAGGPALGSFDDFISTLKGRGTAKQDVTLIGHGTGREGGFFGFGGPVNKTSGGCDDVHFTRATGMSFDAVQAKKAELAIAGKALTSLTLAACNSGVDPQMVQQLADALGVVVKSFSDPVTMCLGGKPGSFTRGKVLSGSEVPELASCNDITALAPDRSTNPRKPSGGAEVRDLEFDPNAPSSVTVLDDQTLTIPPVQITDLTPAGRAKARNFYASQHDRYTPAFITRMQTALGIPAPTGKIDDPTLDAIATFQDTHPPLKGDGMAGPRTLSRLLEFGLATQTDRTHYSGLIDDAVDGLKPASSIDERLAAAWGAVIPSLTEEQVTPIPAVSKGDTGGEGGFRISEWTAFITPQLLDPIPLPQDKRMNLRRTVYHEARHAEQLYNQARMLAGKGRSAKEITGLIGTTNKPEVAEEAQSRPLTRGSTEFVVAEQMFEASHGEAGKRHDALEKEVVAKRKARDDALAAAGGNRTDPRVVKAQAEYDRVHAQYADLADEADAFATSDDAARTPRDSNLEL